MSFSKYILTLALLLQIYSCNYVPLVQEPEPKRDIEPLLASIALVTNALGFLNFEYSSCSNAESIALTDTKSGTLSGQKMKFYKITGPGAGSQNVKYNLTFQRSNPSNQLIPVACLVVGKENRNIDVQYSLSQVDLPTSSDTTSLCRSFWDFSTISTSPSFRCIGIEAYENITYTLTTSP